LHSAITKFDGSGYPNGLPAGTFAGCAGGRGGDVFDALVSERPYKHAWNMEDSIGLKGQRGKHFDPTCIDAFLGDRVKIRRSSTSLAIR
jgi:response regulator RpfG family c-di-GMP phosphodiesterase